jgi:hypothetical protein
MATQYTASAGLPYPALDDENWHLPLIQLFTLLDALGVVGPLAVKPSAPGDPAPIPSTTLNVNIAAGKFVNSTGAVVTYAGTSAYAIDASSTKVLYLTEGGTLTKAAAYPAAFHVRLATITTNATTITALTDDRLPYHVFGGTSPYLPLAGGTLTDGANIVVGSTTGTKIGTATTQKLAFFNSTPIVQQANTSDLKDAFCSFGFMVNGGASPLNLDAGALTCGAVSASTGAFSGAVTLSSTLAVNGAVTIADGINIALNTTTGTKIGTGTTQKLGFFNATPVAQQASTTDLKDAFCNLGFMVNSGASPLNLDAGALTCGAVSATTFAFSSTGTFSGAITIADAINLILNTTTGTKIGTAVGQKLGFWNATPIVQPSGAAQAALTNSSGGTANGTIEAVGATNSGDVSGAINNNFTELHTLLDAIRTALVNAGLMKGSA